MRRIALVVTLFFAEFAIRSAAQCTCDPGKMVANQGVPPDNFTFADVTYIPSADGCDLTVRCGPGWSPLSFTLYYSSTADGNTPILDPNSVANLKDQPSSVPAIWSTFDFNYMRCTNGDWLVYMPESNYLGENDPSGDPTNWFMYNNIVCVQPDIPPPSNQSLGSSPLAMDKSTYMGAPGSGTGGGGSGYAKEEYAWSQPSADSFGSGGGSSNPPGVTKPRTDQSCYMGGSGGGSSNPPNQSCYLGPQ